MKADALESEHIRIVGRVIHMWLKPYVPFCNIFHDVLLMIAHKRIVQSHAGKDQGQEPPNQIWINNLIDYLVYILMPIKVDLYWLYMIANKLYWLTKIHVSLHLYENKT
ncbi:hypothetical protein ACJX0J_013238 [Zea mays]